MPRIKVNALLAATGSRQESCFSQEQWEQYVKYASKVGETVAKSERVRNMEALKGCSPADDYLIK